MSLLKSPKASPSAPHPAGKRSQDNEDNTGRWLVTDMAKLGRLMEGFYRNFPHPFPDFCGQPVLQTNELLNSLSVFGRLGAAKSYQTLPIFTKNAQRTGSNSPDRGGITGVFRERFY